MRSQAAALAVAFAVAACATPKAPVPGAPADPITGAVSQPFKDLSLIREPLPPLLSDAAAAPYAIDDGVSCSSLVEHIGKLDEVLGPDLDRSKAERGQADDILSDALRSALGLPFRGVIRRLTGASQRDQAKAEGVLAGMVRRGFLKGMARAKNCPSSARPVE